MYKVLAIFYVTGIAALTPALFGYLILVDSQHIQGMVSERIAWALVMDGAVSMFLGLYAIYLQVSIDTAQLNGTQ